MAGLALYGDLTEALSSKSSVVLTHRLESVKILPNDDSNPRELYAAITAEAVSRVEVQVPLRKRVFSMQVTAMDGRDRGQPTSWSAAIDALAAGRSFDPHSKGLIYLDQDIASSQRLFIVSAGNVHPDALSIDHIGRSLVEPVHDPAQAWNVLTVGAFTEKVSASRVGWRALARAGDLSPWSTTSAVFAKDWPIKPDIVLEGGNVSTDNVRSFDEDCPELLLLTTNHRPLERLFTTAGMTSAATAQAARMAAHVSAQYPEFWPETIRGLLVHSARWTDRMQDEFAGVTKKADRVKLARRYGYGVPGLDRASRSASDSLTLIAQRSIRPFHQGTMREMHLFELPWPEQALRDLGSETVRLRVTLSYFIEPNPADRGWRNKYKYASHGLRFSVKEPLESIPEFRKRLNAFATAEDERKAPSAKATANWFFGDEGRRLGSLHSDTLEESAAALADRGVVCVYPVGGWWKALEKRDRSELGARYSLIVSLETEASDVDIWTPVAALVGVPTSISVEIET